jgi:secondary thiamine-phosphate synthase enzyme
MTNFIPSVYSDALQHIGQLSISTRGKGLYDITDQVARWVGERTSDTALLTLFCRHTSASLTIQENYDPDVIADIKDYFERLVPEDPRQFRHTLEGPDDMPAHIRTVLSGINLTIPVDRGKLTLGTWQGIYLFEHRRHPHQRNVVLHLLT